MLKIRNQQNQLLCLVYSNKGHLVFLYYPALNTRGISDTCYYTTELAYNSKLLSTIADSMITDNGNEIRQWLQSNPINMKFTTADNGSVYLMLNHDNLIVRSLNENGQEKYTFVHPFSVPIICALADYLSGWYIASIMHDLIGSKKRRGNQQQTTYPQQVSYPQQPQYQQPGVYPNQNNFNQNPQVINQVPQQQFPQQFPNQFPSPDEIG